MQDNEKCGSDPDRISDEALHALVGNAQGGIFTYEPNSNYAEARTNGETLGHIIRFKPHDRKNEDGSKSISCSFPVVAATAWLGDPDETLTAIADFSNAAPALAAEVLELRALVGAIAPVMAVMKAEGKAAFDDLDATRKRLHAMHRRAQKAEASLAKQVPALREELSDAREVLGNIGAMGISHDPQVASSIATRAVFMAQSGWRREYRKAMEVGK